MKRLIVIAAVLVVAIPGLALLVLLTIGKGTEIVWSVVRDEWNS